MFRKTFLIILAVLASSTLVAQVAFPTYYSNDFQLTSPGAMKFGLYGFDNPATINDMQQPDLYFTFTDQKGKWSDFNRWGVFTAFNSMGFGFIHQKLPDGYVTDFRWSVAGGSRAMSVGYSLGWSHGETRLVDRSASFSLGLLSRPNSRLSVGLVGSANLGHGGSEGVADVAVRPLGTEVLAVFADYAIRSKQSMKDGGWSVGAATEFLPGIRVTGRYFDTKAFTLGFQFSLGNIGIGSQAHYDTKQNYSYNSYAIRIGGYDRTVLSKFAEKKNYVSLNMIGSVKYQRFMLFDNSKTLADMLATIDAAKEDPSVSGIAINTSGMNVNSEMLWELREKLKDFKSAGKHVVVFVDRPGITAYHFASVADRIVMDPQGIITLEGFVTGRTFLKGTFEKLGLGYDEWRFFKYKSAVENFSRDNMSDADREQRQNLINDYYKTAKSDICSSRAVSPEQFDNLVNNETLFLPQDALARGLVDTVGRWESVQDVIKKLEGDNKRYVGRGSLTRFNLPTDNHWGEPPHIALIYALGVCAMDQGIRARSLVHDVEAAVNDRRVKAIVVRVDSPGGDAMASDYIAEAMKKAKGKKPVIVSQGAVAGSGGYWLSMYADTIVAAPQTITGSIGVIGGWIYDNGLKQKLGLTTDLVKAGEHADLGFGFVLPYIGAGIPDRNLTQAEHAKMEATIRSLYKDFVGKVASGRSMKTEEVERIGEGHFYSGIEGKRIGLVDLMGGLETAISVARERAGIRREEEVSIVELPTPGLFDFGALVPKFFGVEIARPDPVLEHLKFRLQNNGIPMPLMPFEEIEFSHVHQ